MNDNHSRHEWQDAPGLSWRDRRRGCLGAGRRGRSRSRTRALRPATEVNVAPSPQSHIAPTIDRLDDRPGAPTTVCPRPHVVLPSPHPGTWGPFSLEEHVSRFHRLLPAIIAVVASLILAPIALAQKPPTMAQFLSPGYPSALVSAKKADRLAWVVLDAGKRNVYTAAAPDFRPVRLTSFLEDNGVDVSDPSISDDGSVVVFVRGHTLNRDGWAANPTSDPNGPERIVWAVRTVGGPAWKLGEVTNPVLSPDGRFVAFVRDGQIYAYAVNRGAAATPVEKGEKPLIKALGNNSNPRWSPDGAKLAFVSDRSDHSFIGIYHVRKRTVTFLSPGVDRDTSPTWAADSKRIAFTRRPGLPFGQQAQAGTGGIGNPPGPAFNAAQAGARGQGAGQR